MKKNRKFDIVVFGATGFTGKLTAEYLAQSTNFSLKWAIAGRNTQKLEAIKQELVRINSRCQDIATIIADTGDYSSLATMAKDTKVVITTVGPYIEYGEPLVKACVENSTDYVDLTGEPEFVDLMIEKYGEQARNTGAKIINCCGFDSIPHDLGAYFTVQKLREKLPLNQQSQTPFQVEGFVKAGGTFSGGTWHSAVRAMSRFFPYNRQKKRKAQARKENSTPSQNTRRIRSVPARIHYRKDLKSWVCPFPTIDPAVVRRSARAIDSYGSDFRYGHYVQIRKLPTLATGIFVVGSIFTLAQFKLTRHLLLSIRNPGDGPTKEQREKGWFRVTMVGKAGNQQILTQVRGGDPGYGDTAKMLAESALCLALDQEKLPPCSGIATPAQAMGEVLIKRLHQAGITFEVMDAA